MDTRDELASDTEILTAEAGAEFMSGDLIARHWDEAAVDAPVMAKGKPGKKPKPKPTKSGPGCDATQGTDDTCAGYNTCEGYGPNCHNHILPSDGCGPR